MKKFTILIISVLCLSSFILSGCTKDEILDKYILNVKLFDANIITLFDAKNEYILQNLQ